MHDLLFSIQVLAGNVLVYFRVVCVCVVDHMSCNYAAVSLTVVYSW